MNQQICLAMIRNARPRLTPTEGRIADFILANSEKTLHLSVAQLAQETGAAPSSVIRFCTNMGFRGFSDFKINLARSAASCEETIMPAVNWGDGIDLVFEKVFYSSIKTLKDTLAMIDQQKAMQAVEMMKNARTIEFYGVGTSATVAMDAYYRLMRIGYPAFYAADSHIMRVRAANLNAQSVAVGLSHCGATIDTIETLRIAKESGAQTIAITSYQGSPICRYADVVLPAYSDEARYPIEAVSARIAHIALLDALCVALSLESGERTTEHVKSMNELFIPLRMKRS